MVPAIEVRVVGLARPGADLAASLSASVVNAGIAAGSLAGGFAWARFDVEAPMAIGGRAARNVVDKTPSTA
jgi:DHA1 family inner membrane transport protein